MRRDKALSATDKRFSMKSQQTKKTYDTTDKAVADAPLPQPSVFHGVGKVTLQRAHVARGQAANLANEKCEAGVHI